MTELTLQSVYVLVSYLLSEPKLSDWFIHIRQGGSDGPKVSGIDGAKGMHRHRQPAEKKIYFESEEVSVSPHAFEILQMPLFDTLRLIFAGADKNENAFFLAVKLWLAWIQPWNAVDPVEAIKPKKVRSHRKDNRFRSDEWGAYGTLHSIKT